MKRFDVVIVGAGHGGAQCAIALRQQGFTGSIALIGREADLPYERPPLSKDYLSGDKPFSRLLIRPDAFWAERQIDLLLGCEVIAVDAAERCVILSDGQRIFYRDLVWSAGGKPRRLTCSGTNLAGVHAVREKDDVDRLMDALAGGARRIVVVGGGYIGLESAAVLTKLRHQVTVVEAADRVLARVAGLQLSRFFESEHRRHGVDLRLGTTVACLRGEGDQVSGVELADGQTLSCDLVIVGVGIEPTIGPLAHAGAACSNGVEVDRYCRTSLPHVFAIGDCAAHPNRFAGGAMVRLESVQNANDMAVTAAHAIGGKELPYDNLPWFWSHQYNLKLQTIGLSQGHDQAIWRGTDQDFSSSVIYLKEGRVIAMDCVNSVKDYVQGRKLVQAGAEVPASRLADVKISLAEMLI